MREQAVSFTRPNSPAQRSLAKPTFGALRLDALSLEAWKETVQLAAECLGDGSALGEASEVGIHVGL